MAQYRVATFNPAIEQSIINAGETVRKAYAERAEADRINKARLKAEKEAEAAKYTTQFDRLGKIDPTGNITYDTNMRGFFNTQVDNYVKIKNAMESGEVDLSEGAQMLNQINGYIDQYKTLAPKIMGQVGYFKQLVKDDKLSNVNNSQMAHLLRKLSEGSSDITIQEINGQVYISDTNSNDSGKSYDLSLNELEAILADPQASLVEERLDPEDLGTDAAFELLDGVAGITQGVERSTTEDGTTVERKTFYDPKTLFDMYRNGKYFDPQLDDAELMNKIWKDEMGEDGDWDPNSAEMRQLAETWLIDKSIADNLPMDRLTKVTKKPVSTGDDSKQAQKIILNDYLKQIENLKFEGAEGLGPVEQDRGYFNLDVVSEQLSRPPFNINVSKAFRPAGHSNQARVFTKSVDGQDRKITVFENATEGEIKAAMKFLETGLNFPASKNVIVTEEETSDEPDQTFAS